MTTQRTKTTGEDPRQLTVWFLANYTQCEGLLEDIAYAYLKPVPITVVEPLLARRPWPAEAMEKMLRAIVAREPFTLSELVLERHDGLKIGHPFSFPAEWKWATRVRNDLAHTTGQWIERDGMRGPNPSPEAEARFPDLWELHPRSQRHAVRELVKPFTVEELFTHLGRIGTLQVALTELAAHLAVLNYNGYMGPGPAPI